MRVRSSSLLLVVLALGLVPLLSQPGRAAARVEQAVGEVVLTQVSAAGEPVLRSYTYAVPNTGTGPRPLVVVLHGRAQSVDRIREISGLEALGASQDFVTAFPQGQYGVWNSGTCCDAPDGTRMPDVAFLDAVLDDVEERTPVDPARVYLVGFSNGGMMAYRYACERSGRVAGIAVVSGAMGVDAGQADAGPQRCRPSRPVSVLAVHGLLDTTVPYRGGLVGGRGGGLAAPVRAGVDQFAAAASCRATRSTRVGTSVRLDYTGCLAGAAARLVVLPAHGHGWTRDSARSGYDTTLGVWSFLSAHAVAPVPPG